MSAGAMYASSTRRRALGAYSAAWGCKAALKCGHTGTGPVHSLQRPYIPYVRYIRNIRVGPSLDICMPRSSKRPFGTCLACIAATQRLTRAALPGRLAGLMVVYVTVKHNNKCTYPQSDRGDIRQPDQRPSAAQRSSPGRWMALCEYEAGMRSLERWPCTGDQKY
eukprot:351805-Chlamydomonas_euryale.AAC.7